MVESANASRAHVRFWIGQVFVTRGAAAELDFNEMSGSLARHSQGDWGEMSDLDKELNDRAVEQGGRIFSAYRDTKGVKFWIITEADRNVTTILLPEDY